MHHRIDWNWIAKGMLVAVCVQAGILLMVYVSFASVIHPAYSIFWTAARLSLAEHASEILYNIQSMTELQSWLVVEDKFRPWAYPPSTLFVLLPFAQLPFWVSLVVWSGIGVALYFAAAYYFSRSIAAAALASASLSTAVVAFHGHFTNLVAAIILASLAILGASPILAGTLLGVAAAIKPQILILAPLALLAGRHYSALISSIAVGTLIGGVSVIVFGVDMWLAWAAIAANFPGCRPSQRGFRPRRDARLLDVAPRSGGNRSTVAEVAVRTHGRFPVLAGLSNNQQFARTSGRHDRRRVPSPASRDGLRTCHSRPRGGNVCVGRQASTG